MTRRSLVLLGLAGVAGIALAVAAVLLMSRGGGPPAGEGDVIAYGCREPGNAWYAICSVRTDGTDPSRLTERLATTDPAWSPDGRRIAFTRNEDVGESTTFTSDDVFVMDADGEGVRQLTPELDGRSSSQPAWSPGGELVYVDGESVHSSVLSRYGALFVIGDDGSERRRLTEGVDTDPDWSPDGRTIAFVRGVQLSSRTEGNDDVWVVDVASGTARQLTRTPPGVFEVAPAWSPDGSQIAFARVTQASQFGGTASIHVVERDGTGERLLLRHKLFAYAPYSLAWSPDGRTIAFETSSALGCTSISLLDVETSAVRPLTTCSRPEEETVAPAWQPAPERAG